MAGKHWKVYFLLCGDGSLYAGSTCDLDARLARHQCGKGAAYTRSRLPVKLVFCERAVDRSSAQSREAALKKLTRLEKLALISRRKRAAKASARRTPINR